MMKDMTNLKIITENQLASKKIKNKIKKHKLKIIELNYELDDKQVLHKIKTSEYNSQD